jgi:hypothetical protein
MMTKTAITIAECHAESPAADDWALRRWVSRRQYRGDEREDDDDDYDPENPSAQESQARRSCMPREKHQDRYDDRHRADGDADRKREDRTEGAPHANSRPVALSSRAVLARCPRAVLARCPRAVLARCPLALSYAQPRGGFRFASTSPRPRLASPRLANQVASGSSRRHHPDGVNRH